MTPCPTCKGYCCANHNEKFGPSIHYQHSGTKLHACPDCDDGTAKVKPPVPFSVVTQGAVPEVVALLQDVLQRARNGEIIGVGLALACTGRAESTAYALGEGGVATLVLATERLKARLLREGEE